MNLNSREEKPTLYDGHGVPVPKVVKFEEKNFKGFDVEYSEKGEDVIYHFWPINDGDKFPRGFAKALETGFKNTLPPGADVRAEYTSLEEAHVLARHAEWSVKLDKESRVSKDGWVPRETYFVCVKGGAKYPLADIFLKHRVFENIDRALEVSRS